MTNTTNSQVIVETALADGNGILRLEPTWVARDFLPPGQRMGLEDDAYEVGERGWITERWIGSTTQTANQIGPPDEGLSYISGLKGERITLKAAVEAAGDLIMGDDYARTHSGLRRLAKILDYSDRIPFHYHQDKDAAALVNCNPKEEAYYFLEGVDLGPHPETFFGLHSSILEHENYDLLLHHLVSWKDDLILKHSRAFKQVPGEGFHVPAGVPHSPGTALTLELQEDSDVFSVLQATVRGKISSKDLLYKFIRAEDRNRYGERIVLDQINWKISCDPYFYENRHTIPQLVQGSRQEGGDEHWIFYNTSKFSGKKLIVNPGHCFTSVDRGVYNLLVWRGQGYFDGHKIEARNFGLDELLVSHRRAIEPIQVENTGADELVIFKFFGPDINPDTPMIPPYKTQRDPED